MRSFQKTSALLAACILAGAAPLPVKAADLKELDLSAGDVVITAEGYTQGQGGLQDHTGDYLLTGHTSEYTVAVEGFDASRKITLSGLEIDVSAKSGKAAFRISETCASDVRVLLSGENTLQSGKDAAGLEMPAKTGEDRSGKLILSSAAGDGSQEGKLTAYGGGQAAGIGGGGKTGSGSVEEISGPLFCGHIEILGGTIIAQADSSASYGGAGIGTGGGLKGGNGDSPPWDERKVPGSVTIRGGAVTARGTGSYIGGAGIGTGCVTDGGYSYLLPITVEGGTVSASGGCTGAGIGGGNASVSGEIAITGGDVEAVGGSDGPYGGAGIGGGDGSFNNAVTIGGTARVAARGGGAAAGIGGGGVNGECGGPIVLEGNARVTAYGGTGGGFGGAGVGSGLSYDIDARFLFPVTLRDSASLTAYGGPASMAVGVGDGYGGDAETPKALVLEGDARAVLFNWDTVQPACPAVEGPAASRFLSYTKATEENLPLPGEKRRVAGTVECQWSYTSGDQGCTVEVFQGDSLLGTFSSGQASPGNWALLGGEEIQREEPAEPIPTPPSHVSVNPEPEQPEPEFPFEDVPQETWYREAVEYIWERGLIQGVSAASYEPKSLMDRGMLAVMLHRLEGEPDFGSGGFSDVSREAYYAGAVAWAEENGVVRGYGDSTFRPQDKITREQAAVMLYSYAQYRGWDTAAGPAAGLEVFQDGKTVSVWAQEAMEWAVRNGLLIGRSDGRLAPRDTATRAEIAEVLTRFCRFGGQ